MDSIQIIERSLRCFVLGLIGLVPVLGVPFGVAALVVFREVARGSGTRWNPAQTYLTWGLATALAGLLLTLILVGFVSVFIALDLAGD
jgi:hypothetical protein